ncbi:MAG: GntR family transcriptional regulator [Clostridia bacterium]|nr:GntR family transcriptional regulator [Clostridia bacterium]
MITRPENITDQVYKAIKHRIVCGETSVGERLVESALAEELNVSKTPVREALARLASERLVERVPGKGVAVRTMSYEEVADYLEVREVLEELAAEKAAVRVTQGDIAKLESIIDESEAAGANGDLSSYSVLDSAFHSAIINMGDNIALKEIMPLLHDKIRVVMKASVALPGRFPDSVEEHRSVLRALAAGDPREAGKQMREHITSTRAAVVERLQLQKDTQE